MKEVYINTDRVLIEVCPTSYFKTRLVEDGLAHYFGMKTKFNSSLDMLTYFGIRYPIKHTDLGLVEMVGPGGEFVAYRDRFEIEGME